MQVVMVTLTWNANKVTGHLPNLTFKFISCACNFIPCLYSYQTGYPVLMFSPSGLHSSAQL